MKEKAEEIREWKREKEKRTDRPAERREDE